MRLWPIHITAHTVAQKYRYTSSLRSDFYAIFNCQVTFCGIGHTPLSEISSPLGEYNTHAIQASWQLELISHNTYPPGTHHCWILKDNMRVCPTFLHSGNRSSDLFDLECYTTQVTCSHMASRWRSYISTCLIDI